MRVLITGAAGFLGTHLAREIARRNAIAGEPLTELLLADRFPPRADLTSNPKVSFREGDLLPMVKELCGESPDLVVHLAAATSAECERDFDLGMRSNIDSTRGLLDALRKQAKPPRFVFASSVAVYGSSAHRPMPAVVTDTTQPLPQSSYGSQKLICEQMVADYSRKGFIDGRVARLMTVSVRPGRPNGAASGFLSGIIREPMHGETAVCPVPTEMMVALASPDTTIEGILAVAEADRELIGGRVVNLPTLTVSVREMLDTLRDVGGQEALDRVEFQRDPVVERIVGSWPAHFEAQAAAELGLKPDKSFREVVEQFVRQEKAEAAR